MEILTKEKILFIQTAFIGDAILCLPAIQQFRKENVSADISVICIPLTEEIFRNSSSVDNTIVLDKRGKHRSLFSFLNFIRQVRIMKFDKIYSFHRSFRTAFLVLQSNVRETYGFSNAALKSVYKNIVNYKPEDHEVKRNLSLVGHSNDNWKVFPEICSRENDKIYAFLKSNQLTNFVVIAPGSMWGTKRYPIEYFREIIIFLTGRSIQVVLVGSIKDEDICNSLCISDTVISSAGQFTLSESVELLKNSRLLISNDSAPTHLAMSAGIPVLMIYCSTIAGFGFYPYNNQSTWVSFEDLPCKPCGIHGYIKCPLGHFKCGFNLKPESIINKLEEMFL